MSNLRSGLIVTIQRSDGRLHSAVITSINWAKRFVIVGWSEAEENKTKEVGFETLCHLNPSLTIAHNNIESRSVPDARATLTKFCPPESAGQSDLGARPSNVRNARDLHETSRLEAYNKCVSHLQQMENEVHYLHKAIIDAIPKWWQDHINLSQMNSDNCQTDDDMEIYAQQLEHLLGENIHKLHILREKVRNLRSELEQPLKMLMRKTMLSQPNGQK